MEMIEYMHKFLTLSPEELLGDHIKVEDCSLNTSDPRDLYFHFDSGNIPALFTKFRESSNPMPKDRFMSTFRTDPVVVISHLVSKYSQTFTEAALSHYGDWNSIRVAFGLEPEAVPHTVEEEYDSAGMAMLVEEMKARSRVVQEEEPEQKPEEEINLLGDYLTPEEIALVEEANKQYEPESVPLVEENLMDLELDLLGGTETGTMTVAEEETKEVTTESESQKEEPKEEVTQVEEKVPEESSSRSLESENDIESQRQHELEVSPKPQVESHTGSNKTSRQEAPDIHFDELNEKSPEEKAKEDSKRYGNDLRSVEQQKQSTNKEVSMSSVSFISNFTDSSASLEVQREQFSKTIHFLMGMEPLSQEDRLNRQSFDSFMGKLRNTSPAVIHKATIVTLERFWRFREVDMVSRFVAELIAYLEEREK